MLDLWIRGGTIIDGTGAARFQADLGIRDGLIVEVGTTDEQAESEIAASNTRMPWTSRRRPMFFLPGVVDGDVSHRSRNHTAADSHALSGGSEAPVPNRGLGSSGSASSWQAC